MSWSLIARKVKLQSHILSAELSKGENVWPYAEIDPNNYLGNESGHLIPGGGVLLRPEPIR